LAGIVPDSPPGIQAVAIVGKTLEKLLKSFRSLESVVAAPFMGAQAEASGYGMHSSNQL
jgi:hypothetical protein